MRNMYIAYLVTLIMCLGMRTVQAMSRQDFEKSGKWVLKKINKKTVLLNQKQGNKKKQLANFELPNNVKKYSFESSDDSDSESGKEAGDAYFALPAGRMVLQEYSPNVVPNMSSGQSGKKRRGRPPKSQVSVLPQALPLANPVESPEEKKIRVGIEEFVEKSVEPLVSKQNWPGYALKHSDMSTISIERVNNPCKPLILYDENKGWGCYPSVNKKALVRHIAGELIAVFKFVGYPIVIPEIKVQESDDKVTLKLPIDEVNPADSINAGKSRYHALDEEEEDLKMHEMDDDLDDDMSEKPFQNVSDPDENIFQGQVLSFRKLEELK